MYECISVKELSVIEAETIIKISMETTFAFENLTVYQKSLQLVDDIYRITKGFPEGEKYGLCSQLQRAIISIPSNIAEGTSRFSNKEKIRFIEIAYGSLMESYCQIQIAHRLHYISTIFYQDVRAKIIEISKMLVALKCSYHNHS